MCLSCTIEEVTGLDLQTEEAHDKLQAMRESGERIDWPKATDEMVECAAYIAALYANPAGGTGGPLHVTVDDYNVDDNCLNGCRDSLDEWTGYDCTPEQELQCKALSRWILALLYPMSVVERSVTVALAHGDITQIHGHVFMPSTEFPIREEVRDAEGNYIGTQWGFKRRVVEGQ